MTNIEPLPEANPADVAEQARDATDWPDDGPASVDEVSLEANAADVVEQQQVVTGVDDDEDRRDY